MPYLWSFSPLLPLHLNPPGPALNSTSEFPKLAGHPRIRPTPSGLWKQEVQVHLRPSGMKLLYPRHGQRPRGAQMDSTLKLLI